MKKQTKQDMSSVPVFGTFRTAGTFRTFRTPRNTAPAQLRLRLGRCPCPEELDEPLDELGAPLTAQVRVLRA